jgi:preprotein translocase subunit SecD
MLDFPRWKVWIVVLTTLLGMLLAVPSFFPEATFANWPKWAPHPQIKLGLDLRGGSRLLLEADTADVAKQRIALMEESVGTEMRRASPRIEVGDISVQSGTLSFLVDNIAQLDAAVDTARKLTQPVGLTGQRDWDVAVRDSTRIVMTPTAAGLAKATDDALNSARSVIDLRVNGNGISEAGVRREGQNRIVVEVPGLKDPEALKASLGKTAKLEFKLVAYDSDPVALAAGQVPSGVELLPYPNAREAGAYIVAPKKQGDPPLIAVQRRVMVSGDELTGARPDKDEDGRDIVNITFDGQGGRKFARVTQDNVNRPFAMILDGVVLSAPNIETAILGGAARITGSFDAKSANALAVQLRSGKLPVALKVVEENTVSPELGQDSINSGVLAGVVATLALIAYMLLTYFRFGVYTAIALGVNGLMVLGIMALAGATLTLPGIAGFVLTIGAAVDANVLINERIREELRRGRGSMQAVEFGYKEASTAIFDANITNVISAIILFGFGTGPLKGFAVVLAIGIATSVFTGVTLTRLIVADYMRRNRPKELVL